MLHVGGECGGVREGAMEVVCSCVCAIGVILLAASHQEAK